MTALEASKVPLDVTLLQELNSKLGIETDTRNITQTM